MIRLSAVVITLNEAGNIKECLESASFCDELVVVDSGSADGTAEIARKAGARVWERTFDDFASQKNYAIGKASGDWVFLLDSDERVPEALKAEIRAKVQTAAADGYYVLRRNRIFGRWMRHGDNAGDVQLRLVRRSKAVFHGPVHERVILEGNIPRLRVPLLHYSTQTISDYMKKLNAYTDFESKILSEKKDLDAATLIKRRPLLRLGELLFFKTAFLDGLEGIHFAILSAYYDFISLAKHWETSQKEKPRS